MEVFDAKVEMVHPYDKNPRNISQEAVDKVAASIREFGFQQPIVVDENMVVIVGHTRLRAAKQLGLKWVPVTVAKGLTEEQVRAYRLADNKTNEFTSWNDELLNVELNTICELDMELFGFDMSVLEPEKDVEDDDFDPDAAAEEARKNCTVKVGDVYRLGEHRLMCGDSTKEEDVRVLMGGDVADMCVTDPPYNVALGMGGSVDDARKRHRRTDGLVIMNDSMEDGEFYEFLLKTYRNVKTFTKPGGGILRVAC